MDHEVEGLGVGLYTAAEGARLLDLPAARVRRWLDGYRPAGREHPPLWQPQLPKLDDQIGLGFLDLMQLRLVHRIVTKTDISLQAMRKALVLAHDRSADVGTMAQNGLRRRRQAGKRTGLPRPARVTRTGAGAPPVWPGPIRPYPQDPFAQSQRHAHDPRSNEGGPGKNAMAGPGPSTDFGLHEALRSGG